MDDAVVRAFASLQCGSVQILTSTQHLSLCGLSLFLALSFARRGFSPVYPVFDLLKKQQFQITIRSATHGHVLTSSSELLSPRCVNKLDFFNQCLTDLNFSMFSSFSDRCHCLLMFDAVNKTSNDMELSYSVQSGSDQSCGKMN